MFLFICSTLGPKYILQRGDVECSNVILDHPVFQPFSKRENTEIHQITNCIISPVLLKIELQTTDSLMSQRVMSNTDQPSFKRVFDMITLKFNVSMC
jgi:hypothetical protein